MVEALQTCNFPLQFVGDGCFRAAYHVLGTSLILKFPHDSPDVEHSKQEYEAWKLLTKTKKYADLRKYLPEILFFNESSGLVVTRKYKPLPKGRLPKDVSSLMVRFDDAIDDLFGDTTGDMHRDNIGIDKYGRYKVLDLGYMPGSY